MEFKTVNPATGEAIRAYEFHDAAELRGRLDGARAAFREWSRVPLADRTALLALLFIVLSGLSAYLAIPKEAEPDIEIPIVYVSIDHEGISPEDSERLLVRPMEQELRSIEGVKEMTANAYEGGANVQLEFDAGIDTKQALQDVREKVDLAQAKLPGETDEPTVHEVKMSRFDPMLVLNIAGNVPERALTNIAKDLKEEFEGLGGVLDPAQQMNLSAANSLLKTLEEPPSHVKFVLATTEPQKVPPTILSRCQRFDLRRMALPSPLLLGPEGPSNRGIP